MTCMTPPRTVLITDTALSLPEVTRLHDAGHRILVAGDDAIAMSLADLALPGAERLWANLNRTRHIHAVAAAVAGAGGCDRMILHAGSGAAGPLKVMRLALAILPLMRARGEGRAMLVPGDAAGAATLGGFADRIRRTLACDGIRLAVAAPARGIAVSTPA